VVLTDHYLMLLATRLLSMLKVLDDAADAPYKRMWRPEVDLDLLCEWVLRVRYDFL